jgi:hypothetical protein
MGNNLDAYRAAIGLFHACKMSLNIGYHSRSDTFHDILVTNLRCSFLFASLLILQSLNPKVNVAFILLQIPLRQGDVHEAKKTSGSLCSNLEIFI